jgi:RNA polymerase sigma-70 factor (ECF subfamily)
MELRVCECSNQGKTAMSVTNMGAQWDSCIERAKQGDNEAREQLIQLAGERLMALSRKLKRDFPRVGRWEQTEDVCQMATMKLYEALSAIELNDSRHFLRLAAKKIRETLIDLARHYQGAYGLGAHHATHRRVSSGESAPAPIWDEAGEMTRNPQKLAQWQELHEQIEALPDSLREMFDLLWYNELSQEQAAEILGLSTRQVKRRWRDAKLALSNALGGDASFLG